MSDFIGKNVLLGNGDVINIDSEKENIVNGTIINHVSEKKFSGIMISKENLVETEGEKGFSSVDGYVETDFNVDFFCIPATKRDQIEKSKYNTLKSLMKNHHFSDKNVWVKIKKYPELMKVVKTSNKSIFFIDDQGEQRYSNFNNIVEIRNYNLDEDVPEDQEVMVSEEVSKKKKKSKKNENIRNTGKSGKGKGKKAKTAVEAVKNNEQVLEPVENKEEKPDKEAVKSEDTHPRIDPKKTIILEVPREAEYKKEGRNVYIDLPDGRKGLRVKRSHGGRVFWIDESTGKYSAISLKKVNGDKEHVVYEVK